MRTLEDLKNCENIHDAHLFLYTYLELIEQGETLTVPESEDLGIMEQQWKEIIPPFIKGTPLFFKQITRIWFECLRALITRDKEITIKNCIEVLKDKGTFSSFNSNIQTDISHAYKQESIALANLPKNTKQHNEKKEAAIKDNNAQTFLILHLEDCLVNTYKIFPNSSLEKNIRSFWIQHLGRSKTKAKKTFITELTQLSFNILNRFGLPDKEATIKKYYVYIKSLK